MPQPARTPASPSAAAPGQEFRDHDLRIRRFHVAGLVPGEIAVVLSSQGLRVKSWAVTETFVRARLDAMGLRPNHSRTVFNGGRYRPRPRLRASF
jgi:hypothetical protein